MVELISGKKKTLVPPSRKPPQTKNTGHNLFRSSVTQELSLSIHHLNDFARGVEEAANPLHREVQWDFFTSELEGHTRHGAARVGVTKSKRRAKS